MGYSLTFQNMYTMCGDQIRAISISIALNVYHFFVLGTSKILSTSYFEILQLIDNHSYPTGQQNIRSYPYPAEPGHPLTRLSSSHTLSVFVF